jgi:hypothetical protein
MAPVQDRSKNAPVFVFRFFPFYYVTATVFPLTLTNALALKPLAPWDPNNPTNNGITVKMGYQQAVFPFPV